jgi:dihydroorotase
MKILIKNGHVIDPKHNVDGILDVLINDGVIQTIASEITCACDEIIDAEGLLVMPGIVDMHVHFRVPGFEHKEDLVSGSKAALAGGVTSVAVMPNTDPVIDNKRELNQLKTLIDQQGLINIYPIASVTKKQLGETLVDFEALKDDVVAFSDDGMPIMATKVLAEALENLPENELIISHCEDLNVSQNYTDEPWPCAGEFRMIERNIEVLKDFNKRMHIAHISCKASVEAIKAAKANNLRITCEATPHHFALNNELIDIHDTYAKVNPPIRSENNRKAIVQGIRDGVVDVLATDHAPHEKASKEVAYEAAANGISGIETFFAAAYTFLVLQENIDLSYVIALMTHKPAELLKINRGAIGIGDPADIAIIDLNETYTINSEQFISKGKNTPFNGIEVKGKVKYTLKDGLIEYKEGMFNEL